MGLQQRAAPHDFFTGYIQHSVLITVGVRYIDLEIDLTFFEEWSARERTAMDADASGRITRAESESYAKKLESELCQTVTLRLAGRELGLSPLYPPELDLLGNDRTGPAHHRLKLFFFVPTPAVLRAGDEMVVEDRLWPRAKAFGTLQSEGRDDCAVDTVNSSDPALASTLPGEVRLFKVRCIRPPKARSDLQEPRLGVGTNRLASAPDCQTRVTDNRPL